MPLHAARWIFVHKNHLARLEPGAFARNSQNLEALNNSTMPRKKATDQDTLLSYPIRTRVTQKAGERLEKLQEESACQSVGEVARMILSGETISCFYRDVSMNGPMEELALIRKELKAIGININQQTRHFNSSRSDAQRSYYAMKTAELYKQVNPKVEEILQIINRLAEKWLHDSSTEKG